MPEMAEASTAMPGGSEWNRAEELFDQLLEGGNPEEVLAAEPDPEVRANVLRLWQHHIRAERENYLASPMEFEIAPVFQTGQTLLNRFRIERMLGSGGMGEVYLAWDQRMEDRVAIKTIARLLASSPAIRRRFVGEVQSARRVTHQNVCRIHELFEDGEIAFFSMEYVEGTLLSELARNRMPRRQARALVVQMAGALNAAHRTGVVHGDFKPGNVIVQGPVDGPAAPRAVVMDFGLASALDRDAATATEAGLSLRWGTVDYTAPEVARGGAPTIPSDIYAFGKVAQTLLPEERIWNECLSEKPQDRPESMDAILRRIQPNQSRRYWLGGLAILSAGVAAEVLRTPGNPADMLPAGARLLVNGFRAAAGQLPGARLVRAMVLTALRQSPRIQAIADEDLLPALRRIESTATLPVTGAALNGLIAQFRAGFWIEGDLRESRDLYSADVRLMSSHAGKPVASMAFHDTPGVIALSHSVARWIRRMAGESAQSLALNPADVASYTSQVPEALEKYYAAMEYYSLGEMRQAIPLLREAVSLDPQFAQAHYMLALSVRSTRDYEESFRHIETAMGLIGKLPERERVNIEAHYYRMTEDPVKAVEAGQRNVAYHPGEPAVHGFLGQTQMTIGQAAEGAESLRRAVALAPGDWLYLLPLEDSLVEAGQFQQALDEFQAGLSRGVRIPWIHDGAASAYMALERYEEARREYESEPADASKTANLQSVGIMEGHFDVAIAAMREQRARARNPIEAHQANQFLCGLYYVTDRREEARTAVRDMADLPGYPPMVRRMAGTASWARRLGEDETLERAHGMLSQVASRWPNALTQALELHGGGLQAWRRNAFDEAENLLLKSAGMAFNLWTLFDLAELYTRLGKAELAEAYWQKFDAHRGTVFVKDWFPGILAMGWLYRAVAAQGRNDRAAAYQYSGKVLDHWGRSAPRMQMVLDAANIHAVTKPI